MIVLDAFCLNYDYYKNSNTVLDWNFGKYSGRGTVLDVVYYFRDFTISDECVAYMERNIPSDMVSSYKEEGNKSQIGKSFLSRCNKCNKVRSFSLEYILATGNLECKYCRRGSKAFRKLIDIEPDLSSDLWLNTNKQLNDVSESPSSHFKCYLRCKLCGNSFEKTYNAILMNGIYCKKCSSKICRDSSRSLRTLYPLIADMYDSANANILSSDRVYARSDEAYSFKCPDCGIVFKQTCNKLVELTENGNTGCGVCAGKVVVSGINDFFSKSVGMMSKWDSVEDPKTLYYKSKVEYSFICGRGHSFSSSLVRMISRIGKEECPICLGTQVVEGVNDCKTLNPFAYKLWDYEKNSAAPEKVFFRSESLYYFKCSKGHEFQRDLDGMYRSYLRSQQGSTRVLDGCPVCSNRKHKKAVVISGVNDAYSLYADLFNERYDFGVNEQFGINIMDLSPTSGKFIFVRCLNCGNLYETPVKWFISGTRKYCDECKGLKYSADEKGIVKFIKSLGIAVVENYKISSYMSVDIYVPEKQIAFDYNGLYWHSEKKGRGRNYHKDKIELCNSLGFRLYYIWEDDYTTNKERVLNWVRQKLGVSCDRKIDARKCVVREVTSSDAHNFLSKYHIQGSARMCSNYGLYFGDELVAVMSYATDTSNSLLLNIKRYATSCNVRGGFSKILKVLENICKSKSLLGIVTFSDTSISNGDLYSTCGFIKDCDLPPDYYYLVSGKRVHKFNYRLKRFMFDPNLKYQDGMSERELADLNKLYRVWDSGKVRWVKYI